MALAFSSKADAEIGELLSAYPATSAVIIPALRLAAQEFGKIDDEAIALVARRLGVPPADVLASATFYSMLPRERFGKFHLQVCTNIACSLVGSEHVVRRIEEKLGIKCGETTPDGLFTLSEVECLGSCGSAPVMMVNERYFENLDEAAVDDIIERCRGGADLQ